ncbi:MAG: heterodisulfide reductase-related iron-sulfur binding cluster [Gammaproteobacteria bacterium]|nr:heterodisulfide reductase-related iron-sulfur binding cluster [Gammaproteobacteria bacterium]MDH3373970.1 heterodisulfide reductase-related iron-sulfur binding cluster [Gammaproteobacteria bacterium]MDH3409201.1 heterodisulfide reductase-related iron-sulfur binding cluster [Gammaproteobacteria bacterium]
MSERREGSLEAPTRHPLDWQSDEFYEEPALFEELERVFDICHGCRRCFNLCNSFPTLFDAVDESESMELDTVPKEVFWDVVDHCYLCDMCYMTKCPYVPPHEWNVDFPHLMLRAKAARFKKQGAPFRDRVLSSTDMVGKLAGIPVISQAVNAMNRSKAGRGLLEKTLGVHRDAPVPDYHSKSARKRLKAHRHATGDAAVATDNTRGKVVLYTTCYGNRNHPAIDEDLVSVFEHNGIPVALAEKEVCCGMPKLELGDLDAVAKAKDVNIPVLAAWVDKGWDIVTPIPSCTLMFKQELPLMFPDDPDVLKVRDAMYDPFEYLMLRHKDGKLDTSFKNSLGKVSYQVPCHLRVQNIGLKTRDILQLVPGTEIEAIERCSGHDGTYAVKKEFHDASKKIARPVVNKVRKASADHFVSDCPMAAEQIVQGLEQSEGEHPMGLLKHAYGLS